MKDQRPINLDLLKFRFPVMAIVSILHRVTGVLLFLFIPLILYVLHGSLVSQVSFTHLQSVLDWPISKVLAILIVGSATYHLFAGVRHLVMDFGLGESKSAGRATAWVLIVVSLVVTVLMGIWLW